MLLICSFQHRQKKPIQFACGASVGAKRSSLHHLALWLIVCTVQSCSNADLLQLTRIRLHSATIWEQILVILQQHYSVRTMDIK